MLQALDDPEEFMEEAQIYPEGLPGAIQYAAENRDLLDNQNDDVKHTFLCSVEVYRAYYPEGDYATFVLEEMGIETTIPMVTMFFGGLESAEFIHFPWFLTVLNVMKERLAGETSVIFKNALFKGELRQLIKEMLYDLS